MKGHYTTDPDQYVVGLKKKKCSQMFDFSYFVFADSTQRAEAAYQPCKPNVFNLQKSFVDKLKSYVIFSQCLITDASCCVYVVLSATSPSPTSPHSPSWPMFSAPSSPQPTSSASSDSSPVRLVHSVFVMVNMLLIKEKPEKTQLYHKTKLPSSVTVSRWRRHCQSIFAGNYLNAGGNMLMLKIPHDSV